MQFSFTFGKTSRGEMWDLEKTIDFPFSAEGIRIGRENNNEKRFDEQTITTHIIPNLFTYDSAAMSRRNIVFAYLQSVQSKHHVRARNNKLAHTNEPSPERTLRFCRTQTLATTDAPILRTVIIVVNCSAGCKQDAAAK